jgi:hypothetical protein
MCKCSIVTGPDCAELDCAGSESVGPNCASPDHTCTIEAIMYITVSQTGTFFTKLNFNIF